MKENVKIMDTWEYVKAVNLETARQKESLVLQYIKAYPDTRIEDICLCTQTEGLTTRVWVERKGDKNAQ